ncbi:MAG: AzlD domain-containing protein [Desulfuromonas sp.]|nr:MAG: AzlD domain-containing protein [Desulfuromonas sp.]
MTYPDYLLLLIGMGLVTYLPRMLPLVALAQRRLPQGLIDWLGQIPVAILAALVAPGLFVTGEPAVFTLTRLDLWVAIPTLLFAVKTRSLGGTVFVGMALFWGGGLLLG